MLIFAETPEDVRTATGEIRAGGTDVQARRRAGVSSGPLVDITDLTELTQLSWQPDGSVQIGALVKLDTLANDGAINQQYPGFAQAAGGLATPQIRHQSTLGGSLLQRTRCWYFRNPAFDCYKKGGTTCPSRTGEHRNGVCFDRGPCIYPHPSTLGMTLLAYDATFVVQGQAPQPITALYGDGSVPDRDHLLPEHALLTAIHLPAPLPSERASYLRAISRAEAEWPLVETIVRLGLASDGRIAFARVGVGGVAPVPLRLPQVEAALVGQLATQAVLAHAAAQATEGTQPLPQTGYKVPLLQRTVLEGLERASQGAAQS